MNENEDFDKDTGLSLKTSVVNRLKPEISKALKSGMITGKALEQHSYRLLNGQQILKENR